MALAILVWGFPVWGVVMNQPRADSSSLQLLLDQESPGDQANERLIAHAWQRLLLLTRKMLRNYPRLRRWEQTEDVFQTAALKLHHALRDVKPSSTAEFFGLAALQIRRTLIDLARHHFGPEGEAAHHHSEVLTPDRSAREPADGCRPETLSQWTEFHEAVGRLPDDARSVFQMIWYSGLAQAEVARLLSVSVPTVQRRWYAAQIQLCRELGGEAPQ